MLGAFAPSGLTPSYSAFLLSHKPTKKAHQISIHGEAGFGNNAYSIEKKTCNILRMYNNFEDIFEFVDVFDNSYRASTAVLHENMKKIQLTGDYKACDVSIAAQYALPTTIFTGQCIINIDIPFRYTKIGAHEITLPTLPAHPNATDQSFFNNIVKDVSLLKKILYEHGDHFSLVPWSKTDLGDITLQTIWNKQLSKKNNALGNANMYAMVGVSAPTGQRANPDFALSIPHGNDGSWGIPYGIGLSFKMIKNVYLGSDFRGLHLTNRKAHYRLKTSLNQTEFLLPQKGLAVKKNGHTMHLTSYVQLYHFYQGASCTIAYEYTQHNRDSYVNRNTLFNETIINSSKKLEPWHMHLFHTQVQWDIEAKNKPKDIISQIRFFYKQPLAGKRILKTPTIGGAYSINF